MADDAAVVALETRAPALLTADCRSSEPAQPDDAVLCELCRSTRLTVQTQAGLLRAHLLPEPLLQGDQLTKPLTQVQSMHCLSESQHTGAGVCGTGYAICLWGVPMLAAARAELAATPAASTQALEAALMEGESGPEGFRCTSDCTSCSTRCHLPPALHAMGDVLHMLNLAATLVHAGSMSGSP